MVPRRDRDWLDDSASDGLAVFVPGVLGAGLLMSAGVLVMDAIRGLTGGAGLRRRLLLGARTAAVAVIGGQTGHGRIGLRPRWVYTLVALGALGVGGYGVAFSFWNYVLQDHMWSAIGWILALSVVAGSALIWLGVGAAGVALRWPEVPWFSWPLLLRTPLGQVPRTINRPPT